MLDAQASKAAVQAELDDLLMVFGDLEEKVAKYKVCEKNGKKSYPLGRE